MATALSRLGRLALGLGDLALSDLFQTACLGCGRVSQKALCTGCDALPWLPDQPGHLVQSALSFREPWRTLLHEIKFRRQRKMLGVFRPVIAQSDFSFVSREAVVVPVPMHHRAFSKRGFNQSEILAGWVAKELGLPLAADSLRKTRSSVAQSTLDRSDRHRNLKQCFRWVTKRPVPPHLLLVDDVFTTGATLDACAVALRLAGASFVQGWTLFRASCVPKTEAFEKLNLFTTSPGAPSQNQFFS